MTVEEALEQLNLGPGINEDVSEEYNEATDMAIEALENQSKTAKWVKHDTGHSVYFDCSLCHCFPPHIETADMWHWKLSNYCPDCGAKMENAVKVANRGNCLMCGKEITNGDSIFICNDCFVSCINYIHPIGSEVEK